MFVRAPRRETLVALDGISLTVSAGEIVALAGPNGAGKSTLLRVLATLLLPDGGTALVGGHDVCSSPVAVRRVATLVAADDRSFSLRLTGRENLEFFAALHGRRGPALGAAVDAALASAGLVDAADDSFATYSSGMRQRLALARGLATGASVLLLDEPFRSLDADSAARLREMLLAASQRGAAALVVTHHPSDLDGVASRVVELRAGRVSHDGPVATWAAGRAGATVGMGAAAGVGASGDVGAAAGGGAS